MAAPVVTPELVIHRRATFQCDRKLRITLERWWGDGKRVCFIGLNPSTADHLTDDPTVRRWVHFAKAWGYDGFKAVNLYPFRSSSPAECKEWSDWESHGPDWYTRDDIVFNIHHVGEVANSCDLVVACWGAGWWDGMLVESVKEQISKPLYCFGLTQKGDPIHPMARGKYRVKDDAQPVLWEEAA